MLYTVDVILHCKKGPFHFKEKVDHSAKNNKIVYTTNRGIFIVTETF